jgi:hypothetical protein
VTPDPSTIKLARTSEIGPTYGLAYQSSSDTLFASAFLRSYVNMHNVDKGLDEVTSYIFAVKGALAGTPSISIVATSADVGATDPTAGSLSNTLLRAGGVLPNPAGMNPWREHDVVGIPLVTKASLGDLEIGAVRPDGSQPLYVVNLNLRTLVTKPVSQNGTPLPGSTSMDLIHPDIQSALFSGTQGTDYPNDLDQAELNLRPFGLKVHRGYLYVGYVYTSQYFTGEGGPEQQTPDPDVTVDHGDNDDMYAFVVAFPEDGVAPENATRVLTMKLNFERGNISTFPARWRPWYDQVSTMPFGQPGNVRITSYAQPILSDIEFDDDGRMILGFRDRTADMAIGHSEDLADNECYITASAGDIVRTNEAGPLPFGPWTPVGADTVFPIVAETIEDKYPPGGHDQTAQGALAYMPGSGIVSSTVMNPVYLFSGGIVKFGIATGERTGNPISLFESPDFLNDDTSNLNKANGLGDLELMVRYPCCLQITCARVIAGTLHLVVTNNCLNDDLNEVEEPHTLAGLNCFSLRDVRTGELPPLLEPPAENAFAYDVRHDLVLEEDVVLPLGLVVQDKLTGKRHFVKILLPEDEPAPCH